MHLEISSGKWRPFCLGRNRLTVKNTRVLLEPQLVYFKVIHWHPICSDMHDQCLNNADLCVELLKSGDQYIIQ